MINKIGVAANNIIFKSEAVYPKFEEEFVTSPELKTEAKSLDALATYNTPMINKKPNLIKYLNVEPLTPITINPEDAEKIEGERIYSSDGKLNAIIKRDEDTYTVYTPNENNENMFDRIETYQKGGNRNIIKSQQNDISDGKYINYYIEESDPKTGKVVRTTEYEDGNLYSACKIFYEPNGKKTNISYYYDDKQYYVYREMPNGKITTEAVFSDKKQLLSLSEYKESHSHRYDTCVDFYNGAPIKVSMTKEVNIPNTMGWEYFLDNEELKPSEHIRKIDNVMNIDGDKKYYSNGAIESNTFDIDGNKTTAYFSPEGMCYQIESDKLSVFYNDNKEVITEKLDNGKEKETTIVFSTGCKQVTIKDNSSYKEILYEENGKPSYYEEGNIEDGKQNETKYISFHNGILEYAREYDA